MAKYNWQVVISGGIDIPEISPAEAEQMIRMNLMSGVTTSLDVARLVKNIQIGVKEESGIEMASTMPTINQHGIIKG